MAEVKGVRPHGNGFIAEPMIAGKRYRHTFNTEAEASAFVLEAKAAHKLGKPIPVPGAGTKAANRVNTIDELADYTYKMQWAEAKSGEQLLMIAKCYARFVGPALPVAQALAADKVLEYVESKKTMGCSGSTINRHLSAISVMAKLAVALKLIPEKPTLLWQNEGFHRLRYFTEAEELQILNTLKHWEQAEYIDLFIFLVDTGARLGEAQKLAWGDIRGRGITFEDTKNTDAAGLNIRTISATPRVLEALERCRAREGCEKGPFRTLQRHKLRHIWNRLRGVLKWMGEDTVIHTFRHTCASRLVQRGVDLYRVMKWMGHKNITMTMRYAKLAPNSMDDLSDVLALTPPPANDQGPRPILDAAE